jgi:5-methylcytosine-specific restriction endonuclease McrA
MHRQRHWTYHEEKIRKAVLVRDNYECQIRGDGCLGSANTVDHIHPKAWGGRATPDNLRAACKPCNQSKGARAEGAQASRPFFSRATLRTAPLLSPSPPRLTVASDYSRKAAES